MEPIHYENSGSIFMHSTPPESFSRTLDMRVWASEMPYGYSGNPPPADTQDFDQQKLESKNSYKPRGQHGESY